MKIRSTLLLLISIAIFSNYCVSKGNSDQQWACYIVDTKYCIDKSASLEFYRNHILLPQKINNSDEVFKECSELVGDLKFIGLVENRKIYDVTYKIATQNVIRAIIVEQDNKLYKPLEILMIDKEVEEIYPSRIEYTLDKNSILACVCHGFGSGNYVEMRLFLVDHFPPKRLNFEEQLSMTMNQTLPKGYSAFKGGSFDFKTLTYSSMAWNEDSSGLATIHFSIKDEELKVISCKFEKGKGYE